MEEDIGQPIRQDAVRGGDLEGELGADAHRQLQTFAARDPRVGLRGVDLGQDGEGLLDAREHVRPALVVAAEAVAPLVPRHQLRAHQRLGQRHRERRRDLHLVRQRPHVGREARV